LILPAAIRVDRLEGCASDDRIEGTYMVMDKDSWSEEVANGPLNTRGWVFQERIMSSRILHFARHRVYYECKRGVRFECGEGLPAFHPYSFDKFAQLRECFSHPDKFKGHLAWEHIVEVYSGLNFTKSSDNLIALSAIAQRINQSLKTDEYQAGLWRKGFHRGLSWHTECYVRPMSKVKGISRESDAKDYTKEGPPSDIPHVTPPSAPSWSWASIHGQVYYDRGFWPTKSTPLAEIVQIKVDSINNNPFGIVTGGFFKAKGGIIQAEWMAEEYSGAKLQIAKEIAPVQVWIDTPSLVIALDAGEPIWLLPLIEFEFRIAVFSRSRITMLDGLILRRDAMAGTSTEYQRVGKFRVNDYHSDWTDSENEPRLFADLDSKKFMEMMRHPQEKEIITIV